ncbi:hypothetical protein AB0I28_14845 [Phytomonospora sp. NPDC050363]|uniref:hypothetical protein n=1 Tax=Phytomonospora sp. NPDC050363 TaxID=3155642 RepID=UPI0033D08946
MDNAVPPPPPPPAFGPPVPQPPRKKPVFQQWWFIVGAVVLLLCVCGGGIAALNSGDGKDDSSSNTPAGEDADPAEDAAEPAEEKKADPYDEEYGTFETVEESGSGDTVLELPKGASAGIVTATHDGSANFIVSGLDKDNEPTGDLLVNAIGDYKGTAAYGLTALGEAVTLEVKADGKWSITIAPVSAAKALPSPAKGGGDAVYLYDGDAATWKATHDGEGNFIVVQYPAGGFPNLAVNEIGEYEGTVAAKAGPSVVTVNADGKWTLAE